MTRAHLFDELRPDGRHIWRTLGYRLVESSRERSVVEWDAPEELTFPTGGRSIVHGGMLATLLDTAMGSACAEHLGWGETFLTADLHVDFYRSAVPGTLRAEAWVVHRGRRAVYCQAELYDTEGTLLASARCTQIVRGSG
ncbi:MAG: thioesterase [Thermoleophilia bacterium]